MSTKWKRIKAVWPNLTNSGLPHRTGFKIISANRNDVFFTENEESLIEWIDALRENSISSGISNEYTFLKQIYTTENQGVAMAR
jgi:hypothetical protein